MMRDLLFRVQRRLKELLVRRDYLGPGPAGPDRLSLVLYCDYEREFGNPLAKESAAAGFRGVLEILGRYGVRATWCTVGRIAEVYPETLTELTARGQELACHTYSHCDLTAFSNRELCAELCKFKERFEVLGGVTIRGFHPPLDRWSLAQPGLLRRCGYDYAIARDDRRERLQAQRLSSRLHPFVSGILHIPSVADDWRYMNEDLDPALMTAFWLEQLRGLAGRTVAIGCHPWVLGSDPRRLDAFAEFIRRLVADKAVALYVGSEILEWYKQELDK